MRIQSGANTQDVGTLEGIRVGENLNRIILQSCSKFENLNRSTFGDLQFSILKFSNKFRSKAKNCYQNLVQNQIFFKAFSQIPTWFKMFNLSRPENLFICLVYDAQSLGRAPPSSLSSSGLGTFYKLRSRLGRMLIFFNFRALKNGPKVS